MKYLILVAVIHYIIHYGYCQFDPRIVKGFEAKPAQFPYMVSLLYNRRHFCGGSAISKNFILTAAHCLIDNETEIPVQLISIVAGRNHLNHNVSERITCGVKQYFYMTDWRSNDIAVLKLNQNLPEKNLYVSFIPLSSKAVSPGTVCTVSGWGHQKYNDTELSRNLLAVNVTVVDYPRCSMMYNKTNIILPKHIICAGDHNGDACQGDSGGPLVCNGLLSGVVSTGIECAHQFFPGLYTNVTHYIPWIKIVTNTTYFISNNFPAGTSGTTIVFPTTIIINNSGSHYMQNNISTISTTVVFPTTFNINNNYLTSSSSATCTYFINIIFVSIIYVCK